MTVWRALRAVLSTLKLALPKVAVGWMFALLTIDFNRAAIVELGVAAVIVTSLLSIHYFLAPMQIVAGRLADRRPILGYRRTPYLIAASLVASLLFPLLPSVTFAMGDGAAYALPAAVALFVLFGLCMAVIADSYHALVAEVTTKESRPVVISVVWVIMILSTILSAVVMNAIRPEFSPEAMQRLYNLTPPIVMISVLLGVFRLERRLDAQQLHELAARARAIVPPGNPLSSALKLLSRQRESRMFFAFIAMAIFAIFLQESLIEVFGAEIFGMSISETTKLQPMWGGGILLGMICMGVLTAAFKVPRRTTTLFGCMGAAIGFLSLGVVALLQIPSLLIPTLMLVGFCAGIFNVGALALMMDMTTDGATGMYMGLWGTAQAMGMGLSAACAGALHTALIGSGLLPASTAYWIIFSAEALLIVSAAYLLMQVNSEQFHVQAAVPLASTETETAIRKPRAPAMAKAKLLEAREEAEEEAAAQLALSVGSA